MIAAWMLYCIGIGLAFGVAGRAAEWACYLARQPTRWAWSGALLGTLLLPVAAAVRPGSFGSIAVPLAPLSRNAGASQPETALMPAPVAERGVTWADFDSGLRWGWGLSSFAVVLVLGIAAARLAALRRSWRLSLIDGRSVLLADDVGPAVAGLWPPRIVIPSWALRLSENQRQLMLAHEEEHVRARDPWLLAASTTALVLAPWNPALWWLLRRLRLAVEMDCDSRVLGRGHSTPEYGELLLQVGLHRAHLPLTAPALGEPGSFLARRIRRMMAPLPQRRWVGAGLALAVAASAVAAACEAPRPVAAKLEQARMEGEIQEIDVPPPTFPYLEGPYLEAVARRYHPETFAGPPRPGAAVALAFDVDGGVIAHATGTREARDRSCLDVVNRLLPAFAATRFAAAGCAETSPRARGPVVYWRAQRAAASDSGQVPRASQVDEPPLLLAGPPLQYPNLLRYAGIEGRVLVRAIIDSSGHAEPASVQVIASPHPGFNQSAKDFVMGARFQHGRLHGRAVRVQIELPVEFRKKD
jgi:TonB family protein